MCSCSVTSTCRWCTFIGYTSEVSRILHSGEITYLSCARCCRCRWSSRRMEWYRQTPPALVCYVRLILRKSWIGHLGRPEVLTSRGDQCVWVPPVENIPVLTIQDPFAAVGAVVLDCRPPLLPVSMDISGVDRSASGGVGRYGGASTWTWAVVQWGGGGDLLGLICPELGVAPLVDPGTDLEDERFAVTWHWWVCAPFCDFGSEPGASACSPRSCSTPDVSPPSDLAAMDQYLPWSALLPVGGGGESSDSSLLLAPLTPRRMVEGKVVPGSVVTSPTWETDVVGGHPRMPDLSREGPFDVHQDRSASGASPRVLNGMRGCQYHMTSYDEESGGPDFSPAYGIQLHDPRLLEYVGAPDSARLLSRSPEYWLHHFSTTRASSCRTCRCCSSSWLRSTGRRPRSCESPSVGSHFRRMRCSRWCRRTVFVGWRITWRPWDCGGHLVLAVGDMQCLHVVQWLFRIFPSNSVEQCVPGLPWERHVTVRDYCCVYWLWLYHTDIALVLMDGLYYVLTFHMIIYVCLGWFLAFLAVLFGSSLTCWGLLVSFSWVASLHEVLPVSS